MTPPGYRPGFTTNPAATPSEDAPLLAAVRACPYRGDILPHKHQPHGCPHGELSSCAMGRGTRPYAVTLTDCLACVAPGIPDAHHDRHQGVSP